MRGRINKRRRGKLRTARMRRKVRATIAAGSIALSLVVVTSDVLLSRVVLDAGSETSDGAEEMVSTTDVTVRRETQLMLAEECATEQRTVVVEAEPKSELSALAEIMNSEYYEELENASEKLVVVDISEQRLWAFENEEIVMESSVVTGMKDCYDTQLGIYSVILKKQDYTMRGSYGKVRVDYWTRFNDAYAQGLHDASWRSNDTFGGETYITNGSHGCVNLPSEFTAELYDFVVVGTPIVVQE